MARPITTTVTLGAAVTTGLALAQSLGGAGSLVLNGSLVAAGIGVMDAARRVIITSAGNDSGITFTVTGKPGAWNPSPSITETIAGSNAGVATTTQDFLTVTSVTASGATASTITAGTNTTGSGPWVVWSEFANDFQVSLYGVVLSGSPTWEVDYTYDDVFGLWLPPNIKFPRAVAFNLMSGLTTSADGVLTSPVRASRLTLTAIGSVQLVQTQQGV